MVNVQSKRAPITERQEILSEATMSRKAPTIEELYTRKDALKRHRSAPLVNEREQFLLHLVRHGTKVGIRAQWT